VSSFIRDLFSDRNTFWLGFLAGALFLWLLSKSRLYLPVLFKFFKRTFKSIREGLSTGTEDRYRLDVIRFTQHQHLTSTMFSLDEIIIEPTVMVRPVQVSFDNQTLPIDTINLTIPYIPDWPELGATYQTPKISIFTALQNRANIALAGNPGSGKTVALAYLASQIARKGQVFGSSGNLLPVFIHAVDLNFTQDTSSVSSPPSVGTGTPASDKTGVTRNLPVAVIVEAITRQISTMNLPRLPGLIQSALDSDRLILLLDGLDELPPDRTRPIHAFIKTLVEQYPHVQIVTAVSFEDLASLPSLGFHFLAMAAWGDQEKTEFVLKWNGLWEKLTSKTDQERLKPSDYQYLSSWLSTQSLPCTPLEMTLKVWAAYAGDLLGSDTPSSIEAYLLRITAHQSKSRDVLERLALQMVASTNPAIQPRQTDTIPITYDSEREKTAAESESGVLPEPQKIKLHQLPGDLTTSGVLQIHSDSRYRFANPILTGYLAGKALVTYSGLNRVMEQPAWVGKSITLCYFSHFGDASTTTQYLLKHDDFLRLDQLRIARWLRVAPKNQPWRSIILRTLVSALQTDKDTLSLAARIVTSLATSGDPGVTVLFRQMLQSENANLRQLAALACGIAKDPKFTVDLVKLLKDKSPFIVRSASLALVAIGDKGALETIADSLVHGNELMRRAAAEALANHSVEGYPTLQDGSTHEDLRVRHAIVYGLLRISQPWAREILLHMQTDDKEWIVRNAAIQAMEEINLPGANIPKPLPDLCETTWLIDYAAKQGLGVAPGKPAYDMVIDALKKGNTEERLQALNYLSMYCDEDSIPVIYSWYFGGSGEIRDAAYQTLWSLASAGVHLPHPQQYGFAQ
jgi:hypothetical protein